jgi:hypothetical protein
MYVIDYVKDESGDWAGLYLTDRLEYQGHHIPTHVWLKTLSELGPHNEILVREWTTDMMSSYPASMSDLLLFADNYKLTPIDGADACILH